MKGVIAEMTGNRTGWKRNTCRPHLAWDKDKEKEINNNNYNNIIINATSSAWFAIPRELRVL